MDSNPGPFNHESRALTAELFPLPPLLLWQHRGCQSSVRRTHLLLQKRPPEGNPLLQHLALPLVLGISILLDLALVHHQQLQLLLQARAQLAGLPHLRLVQPHLHTARPARQVKVTVLSLLLDLPPRHATIYTHSQVQCCLFHWIFHPDIQ